MMLPSRSTLTATSPQGESLHQRRMVVPQQAGAFAAAQNVPSGNQAMTGMVDAQRSALMAGRTAAHGEVQAAQNFGSGLPEHEARNSAQALNRLYREAIVRHAPELNGGPNLRAVGQLLAQLQG